jgi:hypothetical protein
MLWQDTERTLKTIESDSIIGVGTERTYKSVSTVCWLWLQVGVIKYRTKLINTVFYVF